MSKKPLPLSKVLQILFEDFENNRDKTRLKRRLNMTAINFRRAKKFFEADNANMLQDIFMRGKKRKN